MKLDLAAIGYKRNGESGAWLPVGSDETSFGYNDGDESESRVAAIVAGATDTSQFSPELAAGISDWPSLYHLSSRRGNLLRPILADMLGPVLEIGAGMGPITRVLGEGGLEVVAIEGSPRRASVGAVRCADLSNVQVVADTFQNFPIQPIFGTVTLIGVLEYARVYFPGAPGLDAIDLLLERARAMLRPGGTLVIAIENQLGLKYFAGYPEDHLGKAMVGIEDGYGPDTVVTFGRAELAARLVAVGFDHLEWAYPFPDYKLPVSVISERALSADVPFDPAPLLSASDRADAQNPGQTSFSLADAWRVVSRNGLVADVANSFLVRASDQVQPSSGEIAWHYGIERRPEFAKSATFTYEGGEIRVARARTCPDVEPSAGLPVTLNLDDEKYSAGLLWSDEFARIVSTPGWAVTDLAKWAQRWRTALVAASGFSSEQAQDSQSLMSGEFLDALPRNLVVDREQNSFIDLEWVWFEKIPLGYLVFRALYDSFAAVPVVAEPASGEVLVLRHLIKALADAIDHVFNFDDATLDGYWERERAFQEAVRGRTVAVSATDALGEELVVRRGFGELVAQAGPANGRPGAQVDRSVLQEEIERRGSRIAEIDAERGALQEEIVRRGLHIAQIDADRTALQSTFGSAQADLARAQAEHARISRDRDAACARAALADRENQDLLAAVAGLTHEIEQAELLRSDQESTLSWRLTRPLRRARSLQRRLRPSRLAATTEPDVDTVALRASASAPERTDLVVALSAFDEAYYRRRHPDLALLDDRQLRLHYVSYGSFEGRAAQSNADDLVMSRANLDSARETVLLLVHEASRTGAPVLGWNLARELKHQYNVVMVLMRGGDLEGALVQMANETVVLGGQFEFDSLELEMLADRLRQTYRPLYAIANSTATRYLVPHLEAADIPVVSLVHEFSASVRPAGTLNSLYETASAIVFPAALVAQASLDDYPSLRGRSVHILPQGKSDLPEAAIGQLNPHEVHADFVAALRREKTPVVLGVGTITPRKGVEFFVQAATMLRALAPDLDVQFVWVGKAIAQESWYEDLLLEQIARSGLEDRVVLLGEMPDLGPIYDVATVLLLTSRLDPLPNVTIDAALRGLPIVAFHGASGIAEWLEDDAVLSDLVVPYLDTHGAVVEIIRLLLDSEHAHAIAATLAERAAEFFRFGSYAEEIDALGTGAVAARAQARADAVAVLAQDGFNAELFTGHAVPPADVAGELDHYLNSSRLAAPRARPRAGILVRRPLEGFHPLAYAERCAAYSESSDGDPLAHFLATGRPAGPWSHPVIRDHGSPRPAGRLKVLVHGHFHYPDHAADLLQRLVANDIDYDVVLTTTSQSKSDALAKIVGVSSVAVKDIVVVPNQGRDIGPLLSGLGVDFDEYDLVLHIHGKKSPHVNASTGDRWRQFLWENLVGGIHPMAEVIHDAFLADARLGLVFPEDPHLNDWDENWEIASALAVRMGLSDPLPRHFDFPMGTMFWARPAALKPLLDLGLSWESYPAEPVPIDGTMLHALERLITFSTLKAGFSYACTTVEGVWR